MKYTFQLILVFLLTIALSGCFLLKGPKKSGQTEGTQYSISNVGYKQNFNLVFVFFQKQLPGKLQCFSELRFWNNNNLTNKFVNFCCKFVNCCFIYFNHCFTILIIKYQNELSNQ